MKVTYFQHKTQRLQIVQSTNLEEVGLMALIDVSTYSTYT